MARCKLPNAYPSAGAKSFTMQAPDSHGFAACAFTKCVSVETIAAWFDRPNIFAQHDYLQTMTRVALEHQVHEFENEAAPLAPEMESRVTLQSAPLELRYSSDSPLRKICRPARALAALRLA